MRASYVREYNETCNGIEYKIYLNKKEDKLKIFTQDDFSYTPISSKSYNFFIK